MSDGKTMYRAHFGFQSLSMYRPDSPVPAFCSSMVLSPCGTFVSVTQRRPDDSGYHTFREDISRYWQPSEALAYAAAAPRLRQIGERLIRQADELEQAAAHKTGDRPALVEAADLSGDTGSPAGGGE